MNSIQTKRRIRLAMRIVENVREAVGLLGQKATVANVAKVCHEDELYVAIVMYAVKIGKGLNL